MRAIEAMGKAIAHRGPDDSVTTITDDAAFVFRRLSIIDVEGGRQPIRSEDGRMLIILNGEIYNHRELRVQLERRGHQFRTDSDAEPVLHLYEEKGERCLTDLRGMFAFAIWNENDHSLFLARDRVGKKPLYYHSRPDGSLIFASEIKAILQHRDVPRVPALSAIDQFFTLQYVPSPLTAFAGIYRLPPAHWLRWCDGDITSERYWRLRYEEKFTEPEHELREELLRLLRESVAIRLESEVPLGAFLSGGVDSSAVVAFAAEAMPGPLSTFSIGFADQKFDESEYARAVATQFGTSHHELIVTEGAPDLLADLVWHYDQPFGDPSAVPSFHVARITRPHVTVVLNGDGGDESFAGYHRYGINRLAPFFRLPQPMRDFLYTAAIPASRRFGRGRFVEGRPEDLAEAYMATMVHLHPLQKPGLYSNDLSRFVESTSPALAYFRSQLSLDPIDRMLSTDVETYLPDDLLVKMDVATMAHSLEGRSPFLDHKLMEFAARLPSSMKRGRAGSKLLLKSALRGILPDNILDRPKMGFGVPLASWLRSSLRVLFEDTVLSNRALQRGYFNGSAIRTMFEDTLGGNDAHQFVLWDLLMLELWHRSFIDSFPSPRSTH
jgi:asparagine synthase (glutamine-hydrolysing)